MLASFLFKTRTFIYIGLYAITLDASLVILFIIDGKPFSQQSDQLSVNWSMTVCVNRVDSCFLDYSMLCVVMLCV